MSMLYEQFVTVHLSMSFIELLFIDKSCFSISLSLYIYIFMYIYIYMYMYTCVYINIPAACEARICHLDVIRL